MMPDINKLMQGSDMSDIYVSCNYSPRAAGYSGCERAQVASSNYYPTKDQVEYGYIPVNDIEDCGSYKRAVQKYIKVKKLSRGYVEFRVYVNGYCAADGYVTSKKYGSEVEVLEDTAYLKKGDLLKVKHKYFIKEV